jgi:hypothetical protein
LRTPARLAVAIRRLNNSLHFAPLRSAPPLAQAAQAPLATACRQPLLPIMDRASAPPLRRRGKALVPALLAVSMATEPFVHRARGGGLDEALRVPPRKAAIPRHPRKGKSGQGLRRSPISSRIILCGRLEISKVCSAILPPWRQNVYGDEFPPLNGLGGNSRRLAHRSLARQPLSKSEKFCKGRDERPLEAVALAKTQSCSALCFFRPLIRSNPRRSCCAVWCVGAGPAPARVVRRACTGRCSPAPGALKPSPLAGSRLFGARYPPGAPKGLRPLWNPKVSKAPAPPCATDRRRRQGSSLAAPKGAALDPAADPRQVGR